MKTLIVNLAFVLLLCAPMASGPAYAQETAASITVTVLDETGEPVPGAEVICRPFYLAPFALDTTVADHERGITDANGDITFRGLARDTQHTVYAFKDEHAGQTRVYKRETEKTLTLKASPTYQGWVRDERGEPVADATILAWRSFPLGKTDARGEFRILDPGGYGLSEIRFYKEDYGLTKIHLWDHHRAEIEVDFPRGTVVQGRVTFPDGAPLANAQIEVGGFAVNTNAEGNFESIPFSDRGERSWLRGSAMRDNVRFTGKLTISIEPGSVQIANLLLEPPPTAAQRQSQLRPIRGKVLHLRSRKPVPGNVVIAGSRFPDELKMVSRELGRYPEQDRRRHHSFTDGEFEIEATIEHPQLLRFTPLDPTLYHVGGAQEVEKRDGEFAEVIVYVDDGCAISGRLEDSTGAPIPNTWVMLHRLPKFGGLALTNSNGEFVLSHLENPWTEFTLTASVGPNRNIEVTTTVDPVGEGNVARNIRLIHDLDEGPKEVLIRGTLVDPEGDPIPGIYLWLSSTEDKTLGMVGTEHDGTFEMTVLFTKPATYTFHQIRKERKVSGGRGSTFSMGMKCNLSEGDTFRLDSASSPAPLRLVAQCPEWRVVKGHVQDELGDPVPSTVTMIRARDGRYNTKPLNSGSNGVFLAYRDVQEPFLLEFTRPGYQPVVWESGRDFEVPDEYLKVTMKRGPMPTNQSAFTVATGRPALPEEVRNMYGGDYVRSRERKYRRLAAEDTPEVQRAAAMAKAGPHPIRDRTEPWEVRITDPAGAPLDRVFYVPIHDGYGSAMNGIEPEMAVPDNRASKQVLQRTNGMFRLPKHNVLLWTDDSAYTYFGQDTHRPDAELPDALTIYPAATVTIQVVDHVGDPVPDKILGPYQGMHHPSNYGYQYRPKTDDRGLVTLTRMSPGSYRYAISSYPSARAQAFYFEVEPGSDTAVTVVHGTPLPGSATALLQEWRLGRFSNWIFESEVNRRPQPSRKSYQARLAEQERVISELSEDMKQSLRDEVVRRINGLPTDARWAWENVGFLAGIGASLESREAIEALKSFLPRLKDTEMNGMRFNSRVLRALERTVAAMVELEGDDLTDFFRELALNSESTPEVRTMSVVALARIGTERSIAAYNSLRRETGHAESNPPTGTTQTHAQNIVDNFRFTFETIPFGGETPTRDFDHQPLPENVLVREGYELADFHVGTINAGRTSYQFQRFGDQWLLVAVGGTVIA